MAALLPLLTPPSSMPTAYWAGRRESSVSPLALAGRRPSTSGATVVCVLTGNGLKDPTSAIDHSEATFHGDLTPDVATVAKVMGF